MFTLPIKELSHATVYGPNESVLERWVSEMTLLSDEDNLYATTDKTELQANYAFSSKVNSAIGA